ncbi:hypothetical protein [Microvirga mediterraneensis]|uniref:Uncharacterized protein n=1 Tax=Microvirga mediterraneensis TaxID=2754695 RepID=A0A838BMP5_9HYPH|nr:hypothetical protein [Microvirga mediterraneensis]MBA1156944.1 hypothetical protein [Microvirga mediterraneensis]MBA1157740.1 hypothetical protein [Microvirga mediterraneensis]
MSEMVEKVARAIFSTNYHPDDGEFASRMFDNDDHPQEKRRAYRAARLAIEAMREPTEGMVDACGTGECRKWARGVWAEMIGAALRVSDEHRNGEDPKELRAKPASATALAGTPVLPPLEGTKE